MVQAVFVSKLQDSTITLNFCLARVFYGGNSPLSPVNSKRKQDYVRISTRMLSILRKIDRLLDLLELAPGDQVLVSRPLRRSPAEAFARLRGNGKAM